MKKIILAGIILMGIFLQSCQTGLTIQKRHYRKGFYVNMVKPVNAHVNEAGKQDNAFSGNQTSENDKQTMEFSIDKIPVENEDNIAKNESISKPELPVGVRLKQKLPVFLSKQIRPIAGVIPFSGIKKAAGIKHEGITNQKHDDGYSLLWIVILVLILLWLLGVLSGGWGLGGLLYILLVIALILLILWLLRVL